MANVLNHGDVDLDGDDFPDMFEFTIPVLDGLLGAYLLAPDGNVSRNIAPGGVQPTLVGAPSPGTFGHLFNGSNYIDTGIQETSAMTLVAVVADPTGAGDSRPGFVGNFAGPATGGVAIYANDPPPTPAANAVRNNANSAVSLPGSDLTLPALLCFTAPNDGTSVNVLQDFTAGTQASGGGGNLPRTVDATRSLQIGAVPFGQTRGESEVALVLIYARALAESETSRIAGWAREYMAAQDVVV